MTKICIFEDKDYSKFLPLSYTRAVYELKCGMRTLLDKIVSQYSDANVTLYCREDIASVLKERYQYPVNEKLTETCLFINGRILAAQPFTLTGEEEIGVKDSTLVYARISEKNLNLITPEKLLSGNMLDELKNSGIKIVQVDCNLMNYTWDIVNKNPEEIEKDFLFFAKQPAIEGNLHDGVNIINRSQVHIEKEAEIKPGVVLDASNGSIFISEDVTIEPNAVIEGPCYVGKKSIIRLGAKIREGTSIGEMSRVGGEVEESIIHSYSNKQHDGFLGHAYLGMWCNLGASTNNSDLKNNMEM